MKVQLSLATCVVGLSLFAFSGHADNHRIALSNLVSDNTPKILNNESIHWVQDNLPECLSAISIGYVAVKECMAANGYLDAQINWDSSDLSLPATLSSGKRTRVTNILTGPETPSVTTKTLRKISGLSAEDYFNLTSFTELAYRLETYKILENAKLDFFPVDSGKMEVVIHGAQPKSATHFGIFTQPDGLISLGMNGRHYADIFVPGFVDYSISIDGTEGTYSGSLQLPMNYTRKGIDKLQLQIFLEPTSNLLHKGYEVSYLRQYHRTSSDLEGKSRDIKFSFTKSQSTETPTGNRELDTYLSFEENSSRSLTKNSRTKLSSSYKIVAAKNKDLVVQFRIGMLGYASLLQNAGVHLNWSLKLGSQIGKIENTPIRERFYLGGAKSIRGLGVAQIGTENKVSNIAGGTGAFSGQFEIEKSFSSIAGIEKSVGLHLDVGMLFADRLRSPLYASTGVFYRQDLADNFRLDLSMSSVVSQVDKQKNIGISIINKF